MDEEFIGYQAALTLRELGFNEPCFAMFQKNKKLWYCQKNKWITNFYINPDIETLEFHIKEYPNNTRYINGKYFLISCFNFTAPTITQTLKWFRDKHNLHGHVKPIGFNVYELRIHQPNEENELWEQWGRSPYDSHEEAEIACINKLIEIVLEKSEA